ncbi:MAG: hypothetical protein FE834_03020 [Gammaproteobacteria bacterium]|nr:hypothetical protein [Gammaproteobacteria bacterium]
MQIKDIKALVTILDNSFVYLLIMLAVALLVLCIAGYYGWQKIQLKRRNDKKKRALKILKSLDFNDSKTVAYHFSCYAIELVDDTNKQEFEAISRALLDYKYKKQVGSLSQDLVAQVKRFVYV